jgi:hypothetical protein
MGEQVQLRYSLSGEKDGDIGLLQAVSTAVTARESVATRKSCAVVGVGPIPMHAICLPSGDHAIAPITLNGKEHLEVILRSGPPELGMINSPV